MKDHGGPAFPRPISNDETQGECHVSHDQEGMYLRDWFAGKALAHLANGSSASIHAVAGGGPRAEQQANVAKWAYSMADAMLAERSRGDA